jgi:hypothetical protein
MKNHRPTYTNRGVQTLVAHSSRGRCTQHLRRIHGCDAHPAWIGAYVKQILREKPAYDVRHVACVHHANAGADPGELGVVTPWTCSRPPNFFLNKLVNYSKKIARNILWTLFTFISDLKIIQQHNIATQYHFAANLYRQVWPEIASHSASRFKNVPGRTPDPPQRMGANHRSPHCQAP